MTKDLDFVAETLLSGGDKSIDLKELIYWVTKIIDDHSDIDGLNYEGIAEDLIKEFPKILEA